MESTGLLEQMLWSRNTCLSKPGFYSCSIDSLTDLVYYCVHENQVLTEETADTPILRYLVELSLLRDMCLDRQQWSSAANNFWDYCIEVYPSDFCPKGTITASLGSLLYDLGESRLFKTDRRMICESCGTASSSDYGLGPLYLSRAVLESSNYLVELAINKVLSKCRSRATQCCGARYVFDSNTQMPACILVQLPLYLSSDTSRNLLPNPVFVSQACRINGVLFTLKGALRSTGNHFTCIVNRNSSFLELDDLASSVKEYNTFHNAGNRNQSNLSYLNENSSIWMLLYEKCVSNDSLSVTRVRLDTPSVPNSRGKTSVAATSKHKRLNKDCCNDDKTSKRKKNSRDPTYQSKMLLWSENNCLSEPGVYSCSTDSVSDLIYYCVYESGILDNQTADTSALTSLISVCVLRSSCSDRHQWSLAANTFWYYCMQNYPDDFCPRGTIRASISSLLYELGESRIFKIDRIMICEVCAALSPFDYGISPVYLSADILESSNYSVESAINRAISKCTSRQTQCCGASYVLDSNTQMPASVLVQLPLTLSPDGSCHLAHRVFVSTDNCRINGVMYTLKGAIRSTGSHFTCIVNRHNAFFELDDLCSSVREYKTFHESCNRGSSDTTSLKIESCISVLLYVRSDRVYDDDLDVDNASAQNVTADRSNRKYDYLNENKTAEVCRSRDILPETVSDKPGLKSSVANDKLCSIDEVINNVVSASISNTCIPQKTSADRAIETVIAADFNVSAVFEHFNTPYDNLYESRKAKEARKKKRGMEKKKHEKILSRLSLVETRVANDSDIKQSITDIVESLHDLRSQKFESKFFSRISVDVKFCAECTRVTFHEDQNEFQGKIICGSCFYKLSNGKENQFKYDNNLDPGHCSYMDCLNTIEKRFVNLVNAFMTIVCLPGGQKAKDGQAIHFANDMSQCFDITIPEALKVVSLILLNKDDKVITDPKSFVRGEALWHLWRWLKQNNPLYQHVDLNTLPMLFMRGNRAENAQKCLSVSQEYSFIQDDYVVPSTKDYINLLRQGKFGTFQFNFRGRKPISIYREKHLEEKSFVALFPYGVNGFEHERKNRLTLHEYLKARLCGKDPRFRLCMPYIFWSLNLLEQERLQNRISIALKSCKGDACKKIDLDYILSDESYSFFRNIRGTTGYWNNVMLNLLAKVSLLGAPTWFLTLSADDLHWDDYVELFKIDEVDEHKSNLISNPVLSAKQFRRRWLAAMKFIKESKVIGEVTDSFARVEFQARGSPHLHIFLWIAGAPSIDDPEQRALIPDFIDMYSSANLPDDPVHRAVVEKYQVHAHSPYCQRKGQCRFGFPKPPCERTKMCGRGLFRNRKKIYEIRRDSASSWVNPYNLQILMIWLANMDIQFVGSVFGVAAYVCEYICKCEPMKLQKAVADVIQQVKESPGLTERQILTKYGNAVITKRVVGAQEASFRILGIPLNYSTRQTVYLNCRLPEEQHRVLKPAAVSQLAHHADGNFEEELNEDTLFLPNIADYYTMRPATEEFEHMSLARFASMYRVTTTDSPNAMQLINCDSKIMHRRKPAALRTNRVSITTHPEQYFFRLLMLHVPFRSLEEFKVKGRDYQNVFVQCQSKVDTKFLGHDRLSDELLKTIQKLRVITSTDTEDLIVHMSSGTMHAEESADTCGVNIDGIDLANDEEKEISSCNTAHLSDLREYYSSLFRQTWSDNELAMNIEKLNSDQRTVFDEVKARLVKISVDAACPDPLYMFVSGSAGTGKSFLIHVISEVAQRIFDSSIYPVVLRCSLTGMASKNITGATLHSCFMLPVDRNHRSEYLMLNGEILANMRRVYAKLKLLIIDEISMVSYRNLSFISRRLCEIFNTARPFGGVSVLALGDFCQLKPVMDAFLFSPVDACFHIFNDLFCRRALSIPMRQKDERFFMLLQRLRLGCMDKDDIALLMTRIGVHEKDPSFNDAIRIFATKKRVYRYNTDKFNVCLLEGGQKKFSYLAKTRKFWGGEVDCKTEDNHENLSGMPDNVELCVNARVMLIRNLSPDDDLMNGSMGNVESFRLDPQSDEIKEVLVRFDDGQSHLIEPITVKYQDKRRVIFERTQIPLILSWATTVHKIQGLTLPKAVIDLGPDIFQPAMAYVALSRVKTLNDLSLIDLRVSKLRCFKQVKQYYKSWG